MAVNLSGPELLSPDSVSRIRDILAATGLPGALLVIEITERLLITDAPVLRKRITQLKELGVRIAIDDFGVGYSSLAYLRRFPVDVLKIAKPFIDGIEQENGREWAFARLITDLATTLGLVTVAEGIEMPGQHDRLVELGCAYGQGYLYGRPVEASKIDAVLVADSARAALHAA